MAAGRETISLSFQADLGDLKRQLATMPGVTKKQAQAMVRELNTGFKQAERAAAKAAKANKRQFKRMADGAAMAATAIVGVAGSVVALSQAFADLQNELADASARTGVAVETLAGLRLAAEGSGLEFSKLEAGLGKLPKAMADAARGTGAAARAFDDLQVKVEKSPGVFRDTNDVLRDTFEAISALPDTASKAAAAMDIFGLKAGPAFLQSGAIDNMEAFVALATEFGVDVGPKAAASAAEFQRQMATLKTVSQGALFDFVDSLGGPGGINGLLEVSIRAVIVLGEVASGVFETIGEQIQNVAGPLVEVAYSLSQGDIAGAFKSLQRNQEEILAGATGSFAPVAVYRLGAAALDDMASGAAKADRAIAALNLTMAGGAQRPQGAPQEAAGAPGAAAAAGASTAQTDRAIADLERLRKAQAKASEARLSERARVQLTFEREIELVARAMEAGASLDEAQAAINVAQTERIIALANLEQQLHDERLERMRQEAAEAAALSRQTVSATADAMGSLSMLAGTAATAMAEAGTKGAAKNARIMFGVSKSLAAAMIPLRLAEALMTAAAQPPPINGLMAATAITTAAAQGISIASAKPPTFDRGGIVNAGTGDQIAAAVLPGEAILSREAVAGIGAQGVDALNDGRGMGGPTVVQMVYRHRIFDEFIQDNMSAPTPLGQAVRGDSVTGRRS